jgi:transposase
MIERKSRRKFTREFKKQLVNEYVTGQTSAQVIADREGITIQFLYRWKTQLEQWGKKGRISDLEESGMNPESARKLQEMEEELEAYKAKVAEQAIFIDLLKKLQPNYQSEKRSCGYAELKKTVEQSQPKKRAK